MAVEGAIYISTLNSANPAATDLRNQGDDQIRLIKQILQATFPNADRPFYFPKIQAVQTSSVGLSAPSDSGKIFPMDTTSGSLSFTLPTSGLYEGMPAQVFKSSFDPNTVTIDGNGKTVNGLATLTLTKGYQAAFLTYSVALGAWLAQVDKVTPTGAFLDSGASSISGYIICDGATTIGDATSGANFAALNANALFQHLWNSYADAVCTVSSGRGVNASADWAAHKRINLPDLRGRTRFGRDTMGSAAGRITTAGSGVDGGTIGASGGNQNKVLVQGNLPSADLHASWTGTITLAAVLDHAHLTVKGDTNNSGSNPDLDSGSPIGQAGTDSGSTLAYNLKKSQTSGNADKGLSSPAGGHTPTGTVACGSLILGSDVAVQIMPPAFIINIFMAL